MNQILVLNYPWETDMSLNKLNEKVILILLNFNENPSPPLFFGWGVLTRSRGDSIL